MQDLLAAFDPNYNESAQGKQPREAGPLSLLGDFRGVDVSGAVPESVPESQFPDLSRCEPENRKVGGNGPEQVTEDWGDFQTAGFITAQSELSIDHSCGDRQALNTGKTKKASNVIFDVDELEDDENSFGDFEGNGPVATTSLTQLGNVEGTTGASDSLGIDRGTTDSASRPHLREGKEQRCLTRFNVNYQLQSASNVVQKLQEAPPISKYKPASPPNLLQINEEAWDDSVDSSISPPQQASLAEGATISVSNPHMPHIKETVKSDATVSYAEARPTNVPPPAILLSMFPELFSEAQAHLFPRTAASSTVSKDVVHNNFSFLKGHLDLGVVAARIVAGRKRRWRRDKFLAQGMRIGPAASSRRLSGMKLTGIDRNESIREEKEAAEVVDAWRAQAGRLRTAVAEANAIGRATFRSITDIQKNPPIRTVKDEEGALTASHPCFLCGLNREERIENIEPSVEDIFSEWWIDHWGHSTCGTFWEQYQDRLPRR